MTFNTSQSEATEKTKVIVQIGNSIQASYTSTTPTSGSDWKYMISETDSDITIDSTGTITVKYNNQTSAFNKTITVKVYLGNIKKLEQSLTINCSVVKNGTNGYNNAVVYLYKLNNSTTTAPTKPGSSLTYNFSTGTISGALSNWSTTMPAPTTANPYIWVIAALASSQINEATIPSTKWGAANRLTTKDGSPGLNTAVVTLYKRSTSTLTKPNGDVTYTFNTGGVSGALNSWTRVIPTGTDPCYVIQAVASSAGTTDTIDKDEWSDPVLFVKNGTDGNSVSSETLTTNLITYYDISENSYTPPSSFPDNGITNNKPNADWVWKTTQIKTIRTITYTKTSSKSFTTYTDWTPWELACDNAEEVKAFNTLTNNGQFEGHFYGVYVWTNGTNAYFYEVDNYSKHLIIPNDSDIAKNTLRIDKDTNTQKWNRVDSNGKVVQGKDGYTLKNYMDYYVNASMIQTGSLLVGTEDNPIFMAGFNNNEVKIAGFNVYENSLQSNAQEYYVIVRQTSDTNFQFDTNPGTLILREERVKLLPNDLKNSTTALYVKIENNKIVSTNQERGTNSFPVYGDSNSSPEQGWTLVQKYSYIPIILNSTNFQFGKLDANNRHVFEISDEGELYCTEGIIGGYYINSKRLYSRNDYFPQETLIDLWSRDSFKAATIKYWYAYSSSQPSAYSNLWTEVNNLDNIYIWGMKNYGTEEKPLWIKYEHQFNDNVPLLQLIKQCFPSYWGVGGPGLQEQDEVKIFYYPTTIFNPTIDSSYPEQSSQQLQTPTYNASQTKWELHGWLENLDKPTSIHYWQLIIFRQKGSNDLSYTWLPYSVNEFYLLTSRYDIQQGLNSEGFLQPYSSAQINPNLLPSLFEPQGGIPQSFAEYGVFYGSPVRFFAGLKNNQNLNQAPFIVLEDGSLYFEKARIKNPTVYKSTAGDKIVLLYFDYNNAIYQLFYDTRNGSNDLKVERTSSFALIE